MAIKWYETKMTSNTTPVPLVASASANHTNGGASWGAFNGLSSGQWITPDKSGADQWIQIYYGEMKTVNLVQLNARTNGFFSQNPYKFKIQHSNDGISWIDSEIIESHKFTSANDFLRVKLNSVVTAMYFRLYVTELFSGNSNISIGEITYGYSDNSRMTIKNKITNKYYSLDGNTLISLPDESVKYMVSYGVELGSEIQLNTMFNNIRTVIDNGDGTQTVTDEAVDNFTIYDVFDNEIEILYYTEEESVTESDLVIKANWTPVDELDVDFEVITWNNEGVSDIQLQMTSIPTPKLVYSFDIKDVTGILNSVLTNDTSTYYNKSSVKYLLSPDNVNWYTFKDGNFTKLISIENENIEKEGMSYAEVSLLSISEFKNWNFDKINIGVYISDNPRDTVISKVSSIGFKEEQATSTSVVSEASFYILNTTAKIDLSFNGLTLSGSLSDEDSTRVQYRVKLNDNSYFPSDGNFTSLDSPPKNIDITLRSSEVKIGDWNTLDVEFKDYFGTLDSWSINFLGEYAGLMFSDQNGEYYSTDVGEVLKYLDFGQVLTGETTPSYMVNIKNQYGYDVTNVTLTADTSDFPNGLRVDFSVNDDFSTTRNSIELGDLDVNEQKPIFIRMASPISTEPNGVNTFDIYVSAKREV